MQAALIYLCMGNYKIFWKDFYSSSEKYFLPDIEKTYFVFTEADEILQCKEERVHVYYQKRTGWPYDTLLRFDLITRIQDLLVRFVIIYFCNANLQFLKRFSENVFDINRMVFLTFMSEHLKSSEYPLERDPKSKAYVPYETKCPYYVRGGFYGGPQFEFLKMSRILRDWIAEDLHKGIIPVWHDESMINAFLCGKEYQVLPSESMMPEECKTENTLAVFRDKKKYGGNVALRVNRLEAVKRKLKKIWSR